MTWLKAIWQIARLRDSRDYPVFDEDVAEYLLGHLSTSALETPDGWGEIMSERFTRYCVEIDKLPGGYGYLEGHHPDDCEGHQGDMFHLVNEAAGLLWTRRTARDEHADS